MSPPTVADGSVHAHALSLLALAPSIAFGIAEPLLLRRPFRGCEFPHIFAARHPHDIVLFPGGASK